MMGDAEAKAEKTREYLQLASEFKYHEGCIGFESTTCLHMGQVKPLELLRGKYHTTIPRHNHFNECLHIR